MQEEIKNVAKERINGPIFGTFSFYMIIAHWKLYIVAFGSGSSADKIVDIEKILNDYFHPEVAYQVCLFKRV